MYSILIVDDENIERQGLRKILGNHFGEMLKIIEAENGREAIEKAYSLKPDIVFMDMKMPGMDGIEVIEEIQRIIPSTKFVIVSAYDSFYYAQKAMNINVAQYLLKPVKRINIISVVEKLIELKDKELDKMKTELKLKSKLNELIPFIENEMVQSIILNDSHRKDIIENLDFLSFGGKRIFSMIIEVSYEDMGDVEDQIKKNIVKQRIEDIVKRSIKDEFNCLIGNLISNRIVMFIEVEDGMSKLDARSYIVEYSRRLINKIKENTSVRSKIGVGSIKSSNQDLYESFKEAQIAVKFNSISAKVIHFEDINIDNTYKEYYPIDNERVLVEKLQLGDLEDSREKYDEIMDWIFNQDIDNSRKKLYMIELRAVLNRTLSEKLSGEATPINFDISLVSRVETNTLLSIRKEMWNSVKDALETLNIKREEQFDSVIMQAKTYIESNYHKELTLESVAHHLCFSPYYFSKMFKQQTGINFIDFLTSIRIEKAKELMNTTELSMKVITMKVGYKDPNYFSRVFKKITGVNPREYKSN